MLIFKHKEITLILQCLAWWIFISLLNTCMTRIDKSWELAKDKIYIEETVNIDKFGWRHGDLFKLVNINGQAQLVKIEPVREFFENYKPI